MIIMWNVIEVICVSYDNRCPGFLDVDAIACNRRPYETKEASVRETLGHYVPLTLWQRHSAVIFVYAARKRSRLLTSLMDLFLLSQLRLLTISAMCPSTHSIHHPVHRRCKLHIPGSLSIWTSIVRTMEFWLSRKVVLWLLLRDSGSNGMSQNEVRETYQRWCNSRSPSDLLSSSVEVYRFVSSLIKVMRFPMQRRAMTSDRDVLCSIRHPSLRFCKRETNGGITASWKK